MDICEDMDGLVLITDQAPRLSLLDPDGRLVGRSITWPRPPRKCPRRRAGHHFVDGLEAQGINPNELPARPPDEAGRLLTALS